MFTLSGVAAKAPGVSGQGLILRVREIPVFGYAALRINFADVIDRKSTLSRQTV